MSNLLSPIETETRVALTFGEETDNVLRDQISEALLEQNVFVGISEAQNDELPRL